MSEYRPVMSLDDMDLLDNEMVVEGYRSGYEGDPEPGNNRCRSFWHGWRNGRVDGGFEEKDAAQTILAAAYLRREGEGRRVC